MCFGWVHDNPMYRLIELIISLKKVIGLLFHKTQIFVYYFTSYFTSYVNGRVYFFGRTRETYGDLLHHFIPL